MGWSEEPPTAWGGRVSCLVVLLGLLGGVVLLEESERSASWITFGRNKSVVAEPLSTEPLSPPSTPLRVTVQTFLPSPPRAVSKRVCKAAAGASLNVTLLPANPSGTFKMALVEEARVCFEGRRIAAQGISASTVLTVGKATITVSPLEATDVVINGSSVAEERISLLADTCLSVYHTLVDVMPSVLRWRGAHPSQRLVVVVRGNCHVFHFGSLLYLAAMLPTPSGDEETLALQGVSDEDLGQALLGRLMVTRQPPTVTMRDEDSAYSMASRMGIVTDSGGSRWCSCGAVLFGEGGNVLTAHDVAFMTTQLNRLIPVHTPTLERLWAGCSNRRRVAVILRRNSRLIAFPRQFMQTLEAAQPSLCFREFFFETIPVLEQYFVMRSAHATIGMHGAALTWVTLMNGPVLQWGSASAGATKQDVCKRQLVELWFVGKAPKSMAVYQYLSGISGVGYRLYHPTTAWMYDLVSTRRNSSDESPSDVAVALPPRGRLVPPSENDKLVALMRKLSHPQRSPYFSRQMASFSNSTVASIAMNLAADLRGC